MNDQASYLFVSFLIPGINLQLFIIVICAQTRKHKHAIATNNHKHNNANDSNAEEPTSETNKTSKQALA